MEIGSSIPGRRARHVLSETTTLQWSSSTRFVVVCTAAIIGLSGFWRLPYLVQAYGGGAFLLVYLLAVVTLGLPLFSGQVLLSRGTQADLPGIMARWMRESPHWRAWVWSGALAVIGSTLLLICYSVIASWSMAYSLRGAVGLLDGLNLLDAKAAFYELARDAEKGFGWQLIFIGLVVATGYQGLRLGMEPVMRTLALLIAFLFLVLLVTVVRSSDAGAVAYKLFAPDFSALTWRGVLEALYQAFFTLSLGTGVVAALGSYLPRRTRVMRVAVAVLVLDLAATLAAAFVFGALLGGSGGLLGNGLQALFIVLPAVLESRWQITLIYVLISLVALAAAIGLLEPLMRVMQCRLRMTRARASVYAGVLVWLGGLIGLLSFDALDGLHWRDLNLFGWLLDTVSAVILPTVGLAYCLFLGRMLSKRRLQQAWGTGPDSAGYSGFVLWHGALRYPTRVVLALVLFYSVGGVAFMEWLWG